MKNSFTIVSLLFLASYAELAPAQSTVKETKEAQKEAKIIAKEEKNDAQQIKKAYRKELRKLEGSQVSSVSKNNFAADFPDVKNGKWTHSKQLDEVSFTKDGVAMTAYYDFYSKLVGTTRMRAFTDLPAAAQKEIKRRYSSYTIGSVIEYDDNENNDSDMLLYGTQFEGADHYFVPMSKAGSQEILMVNDQGIVSYFTKVL